MKIVSYCTRFRPPKKKASLLFRLSWCNNSYRQGQNNCHTYYAPDLVLGYIYTEVMLVLLCALFLADPSLLLQICLFVKKLQFIWTDWNHWNNLQAELAIHTSACAGAAKYLPYQEHQRGTENFKYTTKHKFEDTQPACPLGQQMVEACFSEAEKVLL